MPSCSQIQRMRAIRSSKSTERKLKCWQRDAMVAGILCDSVVQRMKTTHSGGSSSVFRSALKASLGDLVRFVDDEDFVAVARRPVADVLAQLAHLVDAAIGGGVDFDDVDAAAGGDFFTTGAHAAGRGGRSLMQFRQRARMRATVVLPVPRWPEKM